MYFKCSLFLASLALTGCATKKVILPTVQNHVQEYTGSPCVDGTITNIREAGCERASIYTVPMTRTTKVKCVESDSESPWTTYSFYMIPHGDDYRVDNMFLMCTDPMFVVTFLEPGVSSEGGSNGEE